MHHLHWLCLRYVPLPLPLPVATGETQPALRQRIQPLCRKEGEREKLGVGWGD